MWLVPLKKSHILISSLILLYEYSGCIMNTFECFLLDWAKCGWRFCCIYDVGRCWCILFVGVSYFMTVYVCHKSECFHTYAFILILFNINFVIYFWYYIHFLRCSFLDSLKSYFLSSYKIAIFKGWCFH